MANYIIIGGDNKEYGPVAEAEVRQWIAEGRLNAESRVKAEGEAEFTPLALLPELAAYLRPQGEPAAAPATIAPVPTAGLGDGLPRDYELDIAGCFSRGFELVKNNMGLLFVGPLIYLLIQAAASGLGSIPLIGPLFSLANLICSGPLMGGLFFLSLRVTRNEPAELGDVFAGFRRNFLQLFLGVLVPGLLIALCMLPAGVILIVKLVPMAGQLQQLLHLHPGTPPDAETINALRSVIFTTLPVALVCALPVLYLSTCWKFTLALIVDQQLDFATAMRTSWKMVNQHWWLVFGLVVLISLLNLLGLLACCVGELFSFPIGIATLMIAYETIFGGKKN